MKKRISRKGGISATDFAIMSPMLTIESEHVEPVRLYLVDGVMMQEVANEYGYTSRQALNYYIGLVWQQYERYLEAEKIRKQLHAKQGRKRKSQPG